MPKTLDQTAIELQTAVERGDLDRAQQWLAAYSVSVKAALEAAVGDTGQARALARDLGRDTKRMFDWAHGKVSSARAQAAADLDLLRSKLSYAERPGAGIRTWEIEG